MTGHIALAGFVSNLGTVNNTTLRHSACNLFHFPKNNCFPAGSLAQPDAQEARHLIILGTGAHNFHSKPKSRAHATPPVPNQ